jgi:hypothetical protein
MYIGLITKQEKPSFVFAIVGVAFLRKVIDGTQDLKR